MDSEDPSQSVRNNESRPAGASRKARLTVMASFGVSGMAALIYEVAWTRQLSMVFTSTVYALSILLASFMAGLALGGWAGGKWADHRRLGRFSLKTRDAQTDLISDLAGVEFGIGVLGLASVLLVQLLPPIQYAVLRQVSIPSAGFFALQMALAFLVMLAPTTLMGATLPLASKVVVRSHGSLGSTLGLLYSFNTIGAVAGSLLAGFAFIPLVGVRATVIIAAVANLAVAFALLSATGRPLRNRVGASVVAVAVLAGAIMALPEPAFPLSFGVSGRYGTYGEYLAEARSVEVLYSDENAYSRVVVLKTGYDRKFLVNGSLTEGSDAVTDATTTRVLAFLPYAYAREPKNGLIVGLGTGITSQAALTLPLETLTTVEINPSMNEAARLFIGDEPFEDQRWTIPVDDARGYLQMNSANYDFITSEPSWPLASSVAPLFTQEFYRIANQKLAPGGVFCQWAPQYLLSRDDFMTLYKTFNSVFPNAEVWWLTENGQGTGDLFIVGVKDAEYPDNAQVQLAADELLSKQDTGGLKLSRAPFDEVIAHAVSTDSIPLNTDDKPVLQSRIPWELARKISDDLKK